MNTTSQTNRLLPIPGFLACATSAFALFAVLADAPALAQNRTGSEGTAPAPVVLEEVIVTAQKRRESVRDVPATVAALDGDELRERGMSNMRDYSKFVPGMIYSGTTTGDRSGPNIVIRGVSNSRLDDMETSIATATTGFVYGQVPAYAFDFNLADVQRVEVLKGPQGTLYGAAAMGGIVKVVPNLPQFDEATVELQGGYSVTDGAGSASAPGYMVALTANAPLSDSLALRFSGYQKSNPGYINVRYLRGLPDEIRGNDTVVGGGLVQQEQSICGSGGAAPHTACNINSGDVSGGRVALRYQPNEQFDATLALFYERQSLASAPTFEPAIGTTRSPRNTELYMLNPSSTNYTLGSLEASYDFGSVTLHSVSGWLERRQSEALDFTGVSYAVLGGDGTVPVPSASPLTFAADIEVASQELRLQSDGLSLGWGDATVDWTLGAFYQREKRNAVGGATVGPEWLVNAQAPLTAPPSGSETIWYGEYDSTYTNSSFFGDVNFHITRKWSASVGQRYSSQGIDSSRVDFGNVFAGASTPTGTTLDVREIDESQWTPRAAVMFAVTDDINTYVSAAKGFRIGGGNPQGNLSTPGCQAALQELGISPQGEFESDSVINYELGAKMALNEGRILANIALYQIDWSDLQTSIALANFSDSCGATIVTNAGKARTRGVDVDLRALLTDNLQLALAAQRADGEIVDAAPGTGATNGDRLSNLPEFTGSIGLQYTFTWKPGYDATLLGDYAYVGERNLSAVASPQSAAFVVPGFSSANLRASVKHEQWEFATYVSNLTDTRPELGVLILPGGPGNYAGAYAPGQQRFIATSPARTFGIEVRKSF